MSCMLVILAALMQEVTPTLLRFSKLMSPPLRMGNNKYSELHCAIKVLSVQKAQMHSAETCSHLYNVCKCCVQHGEYSQVRAQVRNDTTTGTLTDNEEDNTSYSDTLMHKPSK